MQRAPRLPTSASSRARSPQRPRVLHPHPENRWTYQMPSWLLRSWVKPRLPSILGSARGSTARAHTPLQAALAPASRPASLPLSLCWPSRSCSTPTKSSWVCGYWDAGEPHPHKNPRAPGATPSSGAPVQVDELSHGGARAKPEERREESGSAPRPRKGSSGERSGETGPAQTQPCTSLRPPTTRPGCSGQAQASSRHRSPGWDQAGPRQAQTLE